MDDSPVEFLLNTDCSLALQYPLAYVNLTTALVAMIVAIQVNRVTRQSEGYTGKNAGGGNVRDMNRVIP
jgi:hypothetical protein